MDRKKETLKGACVDSLQASSARGVETIWRSCSVYEIAVRRLYSMHLFRCIGSVAKCLNPIFSLTTILANYS